MVCGRRPSEWIGRQDPLEDDNFDLLQCILGFSQVVILDMCFPLFSDLI